MRPGWRICYSPDRFCHDLKQPSTYKPTEQPQGFALFGVGVRIQSSDVSVDLRFLAAGEGIRFSSLANFVGDPDCGVV